MVLTPGTRLGPYEVIDHLGAGGMGEVYRANDTNLKRHVALKVLPSSFSEDVERLTRFRREAEVLAALNHPNIATIYGVERAGPTTALVMELVEGSTLAERIARGLRLDEALAIATQIAEALESAHERGIVHRDLKPANVKVRDDGTVKVLDFGLAKIIEQQGTLLDQSQSPTIAAPIATQAGVILGTPAYMSPEQVRGRDVDARTDVWAFGCVLFEMLAGRPAFPADTVADALAGIVERDPDWESLPATTPQALRRLLRRCLAKDPRQRLRSIGDASLDLEEAGTEGRPSPVAVASTRRWLAPAIAALATLGLVGVSLVAWRMGQSDAAAVPSGVIRYSIAMPSSEQFETAAGLPPAVAISSDGRHIVYSRRSSTGNRLYRRSRHEMESSQIPGTEGGFGPFFSPDGQWIGFATSAAIMKVPLAGGTPQRIVSALNVTGAAWSEDDTIVWGEWSEGLFKASASGGARTPFTHVDRDRGEIRHGLPEFSADGARVVFSVFYGDNPANVAIADLNTGARKILARGEGPSLSQGHLVFSRGSALIALPFDADRELPAGEPVQLFDGISATGQPQFAVAGDGTLVYVPAPSTRRRLVWVDRTGRQERVVEKEDRFSHPRISPQGDRVLLQVVDTTGPYDFWIHELERRSDVRLSVRGSRPVWEPDGLRITYAASGALYSVPADDSSTPDLLVPLDKPANALFPLAWSRDGVLVFSRPTPETNRDVFTMRRGETPRAILASPRDERAAMLSPDGRWIVYSVREVGREEEVYVQAYPSGAGRTIVSAGGGLEPLWSGTGKEIFYRSTDGSRLLAVDVTTSPSFQAGTPRTLFTGRYALGSSFWADYDVTRDGNRFLMLEGADESSTGLNVVMNWLTPQGVASGAFGP